MSNKASREVKGNSKSFIPHAEKYEPPYGPKARRSKMKPKVTK